MKRTVRRWMAVAAGMLLAATMLGSAAGAATAGTSVLDAARHTFGTLGHSQLESTNWSGYASYPAARSVSFSDVKGSWVEPTVTCPTRSSQYASFWVGLDGYTSSTVEQIGTDSDCVRGRASYYAWYELYPAGSVTLPLTIHAGDSLSAEVSSSGSSFTLTINDLTTGKTFRTTLAGTAAQSSAEWIAEAPSICNFFYCTQAQLSDFGSVTMTRAAATGSGSTGPIDSASWTDSQIVMVNSTGTVVRAQPGPLSDTASTSSFADTWKHS